MTPRGRAVLVLGLVVVLAAIVAATVEIRAGVHECGSAISAHAPAGHGRAQSRAEDPCDSKVKSRRVLVVFLGVGGLGIAMLGAYDHRRSPRRTIRGSA